MPKFAISKEDLKRAQVVKPGCYLTTVKSVSEWHPGKNDPTSNVIDVDLTIESGPDDRAAGVPLKFYISEKYPEMASGFIEAISGKKIGLEGTEIPDLKTAEGRKVKTIVKNGMFNGRPKNEVDGFLPA